MEEKRPRIYLPRSTMKMEAVIAVQIIAERYGVSFGKALEKILSESETYRKAEMVVAGKISEISI